MATSGPFRTGTSGTGRPPPAASADQRRLEGQLAAAEPGKGLRALPGRQSGVERARVPGEGGQQPPPGVHLRDQVPGDAGRVAVQRRGPALRIRCAAASAAVAPAIVPDRSAKLMPSRVHGSSRPAASPASSTRPRRSGALLARQCVRCPESRSGRIAAEPSRAVKSRQILPGPLPLAARRDHADGEPVPLGKHPAVRAGQRPPVEQQPSPPLRPRPAQAPGSPAPAPDPPGRSAPRRTAR